MTTDEVYMPCPSCGDSLYDNVAHEVDKDGKLIGVPICGSCGHALADPKEHRHDNNNDG